MNEILFRGKPALDMIMQSPLFDTEIFYKTITEDKENGVLVRGCLAINVDPEIVQKQAAEIVKLQRALNEALNETLHLCAPDFVTYCDLLKENENLKSKLDKIALIIEE